jgi:hypothetical protein
MSAMWLEGSVGHEWEVNRLPCYGSVPSVVNGAVIYGGSVWGRTRHLLQWFPFDTHVLPRQAPPRPAPGSVPRDSTVVGPSGVGAPASSD